MKDIDTSNLSADEWDELNFPRPEEQEFDRVVERAISRRGFLGGVLAFGSGAAVMGTSFLKGTSAMAQQMSRFAFEGIAAQTDHPIHGATRSSQTPWVLSTLRRVFRSSSQTACSVKIPTAWSYSTLVGARSSRSTANM